MVRMCDYSDICKNKTDCLMKLSTLLCVFIPFLTIVCSACGQTQTTKLPTAAEVTGVIEKVNDRWQQSHPEPASGFWHPAAYHTGNMAAYEVTGADRFKAYSTAWAEHNLWMGARSTDTAEWKFRYGETDAHVLFGDWQTCFQVYVDLYNLDGGEEKIARAREVMEYEMSTPRNDYWWWADGLYMVMPVMTRLYKVTGNGLYLEKLYEYFSFARDLMYDHEAGLFYRDANFVYPEHKTTNGKKDFWARGNGWVFAAFARVLSDLPENDPHRDEYISIYRAMAAALAASQQPEGYWAKSLIDLPHAPGFETSGTAFFTYGFLWGVRNGILDATYAPVIEKGWNYLITTAVQSDGTVGWVQPIGARADQHNNITATTTADFGVGAFLLAASEMYKYVE